MIKKTSNQTYTVTPYGDGCMTCCTTRSASGTSSSERPREKCC